MNKEVVSLIFSKDRALQLQAMLESFYIHCVDKEKMDVYVLYKCSVEEYVHQYDQLQKQFPGIKFVVETDLSEDINEILEGHEYVFFQVDDNIIFDTVEASVATKYLEEDVIGFSFRLGENITYCYMLRSEQKLPNFIELSDEVVKYNWIEEEFDFGYPLEVSSSVYRVLDVRPYLTKQNLTHLTMVEGILNKNKKDFELKKPFLACCKESKMFSLPLNNTSGAKNNRAGELRYYTERELANFFDSGKRIRIENLFDKSIVSCHQEFPIVFEDRK